MADQIQYVSQGELEALLIRVKSAKAIGIIMLTEPTGFYKWRDNVRPTKKNGLADKPEEVAFRQFPATVRKYQRVTGMTCFEYQRARDNDNQRVWGREIADLRAEGKTAEADALEAQPPEPFELGKRTWGERIQGRPFIQHTKDGVDYLYVEMMIPTGNHPQWADGRHENHYVHLEADGSIGRRVAKDELKPWLKPKRDRPNDPKDFDYREVRTDHILEVRHEGVRYILKHDANAEAVA